MDTPWEREAYELGDRIYEIAKNDSGFVELIEKWNLIVKDLSNGVFDIEDIMRSGYVEPTFLGKNT